MARLIGPFTSAVCALDVKVDYLRMRRNSGPMGQKGAIRRSVTAATALRVRRFAHKSTLASELRKAEGRMRTAKTALVVVVASVLDV